MRRGDAGRDRRSRAPAGDLLEGRGPSEPAAADEVGRRLSRAIGAAFSEARATHGDLGVAESAFAERVRSTAARLGALGESGPADAVVESLACSDLYLATACAAGSEKAWRRLLALHAGALGRTPDGPPRGPEETAESVLAELFLPSGPRDAPLIASYDGSGSLRSWLRIVVASRRARKHRGLSAATRSEDPERFTERPQAAAPRPEDAAATRENASIVRPAIDAAFRSLEPCDRLLLRLVYQDRKRQRDVARVLGMTESTVCRRLQRAYDRFRTTLLGRLRPRFPSLGDDWLESIATLEREEGVGLADGMGRP